ncbi:putative RNA-directed DNA polymerase from transposon X-element [Frankliniella fusca]|uniref:RNA-directed DNA polymerase from transposon X-element n=1 Tax=Frankliniella fusca TaxID=407009 RepID=A0AAE1HNL3_9NEOP|nr:putative RNA-directed DNA polymerase from transposon X-element [Frankliniella fusca]
MLSILSWNVNGLRKRLTELDMLIEKHNPDILMLQETMLGQTTLQGSHPNYILLRKDRPTGFRGGVALMIHKNIEHYEIINNNESSVETISAMIKTKRSLVQATSVYLPPGNKTRKSDIMEINIPNQPFIMAGDYNAHHTDWVHNKTNLYGKWIAEKLEKHDLEVHIPDKPTRISNRRTDSDNILDYAITHANQSVTMEVLDKEFTTSDHLPIKITYSDIKITDKDHILMKLNWSDFRQELCRPYTLTEDVNYNVNNLTATVQAAILNNSFQTKKKKRKYHGNQQIQQLLIEKQQANKTYAISKTTASKKHLKELKRKLERTIKDLKEQEKIKRMEDMEDPLKRWQILKRDKPKPPSIPTLTDNNGLQAENQPSPMDYQRGTTYPTRPGKNWRIKRQNGAD